MRAVLGAAVDGLLQLLGGEWLEEKLIEVAALRGFDHGSAHGDEAGCRSAGGAQLLGESISGEAGHLHVDEHGVGRGGLGLQGLERGFTAFEGFDFESGLGCEEGDDLAAHHVVIDH